MPIVSLVDDPNINASCSPLKILQQKVSKAYFAKREEESVEKPDKVKYAAKSGDSLPKIAKKFDVKVSDLTRTGTSDGLWAGETVIVKKMKKVGVKVRFTKIDEVSLGSDVYIIVETENLRDEKSIIEVLQGEEDVLVKKDQAVTVLHDGNYTSCIETTIGAYCDEEEITNKDDFIDWGIAKIKFEPENDDKKKKWEDGLKSVSSKKALLYLYIDAHSENSIPYFLSHYMLYDGFKGGSDNSVVPNHFLNEDDEWFRLNSGVRVPWMEIAWMEYEYWSSKKLTEKKGDGLTRANKYIKKAGDNFKAHENAWCGCFIHWILKETNSKKSTGYSTVTNNPTSSQNYWEKSRYSGSKQISPSLNDPPYGVIAVLHKSGWSGHVGFLINIKEKGGKKYAYLLGGNQNNKVCVQEYKVYKDGSKIKYKTKKGTVYTLKGYVYPKEFKIDDNKKHKNDYKTKDYTVEDAISTH